MDKILNDNPNKYISIAIPAKKDDSFLCRKCKHKLRWEGAYCLCIETDLLRATAYLQNEIENRNGEYTGIVVYNHDTVASIKYGIRSTTP